MADQDIGQAWLIAKYGLRVPEPAVTSRCGPGARKTVIQYDKTIEKYGPAYMPEETAAGHLRFALRYEPLDMAVLVAAFAQPEVGQQIEEWVRKEPNGQYARRAWFLYEWFTGKELDIPDAGLVTYVAALSDDLNVTAKGNNSPRHKVIDNMLGVPAFCMTVRRTGKLDAFVGDRIDTKAREMVESCDPQVLARAVNYLYTKETRSSFEIERETASANRAERFVAALHATTSFDPTSEAELTELQNKIVDPRYAADGYRKLQNFVGETVGGHREKIHFICPKPEDIPGLMMNWGAMNQRLSGNTTDAVVAAALSSFSFVFLHPFEDGNGRIHRFLMHHVLATEGFTPPDILFPVSSAIVRDRRGYDEALESFSKTVQPYIEWKWTVDKEIEVINETDHLYRYFDATGIVEFLYAKIAETVDKDLREELDFVATYDAAIGAVRDRIDMPDRKTSAFVTYCLQNGGKLANRKRKDFDELTDAEVSGLENAIADALADLEDKRAISGSGMAP